MSPPIVLHKPDQMFLIKTAATHFLVLQIALLVLWLTSCGASYVYYPFAPSALYQAGMNVSFVSGKAGFFADVAGYGSSGAYNGALGIALDRTERFAFISSADGKGIRKLNIRTTQVGGSITGKQTFTVI